VLLPLIVVVDVVSVASVQLVVVVFGYSCSSFQLANHNGRTFWQLDKLHKQKIEHLVWKSALTL